MDLYRKAIVGKPIIWFEIHVQDTESAREFYACVFDWTFSPMTSYDPDYWLVETGSEAGIKGAIWGGLTQRQASARQYCLSPSIL